MSDNPHCLLCPGACPIPDCRFALRRDERPGIDEDELHVAHEPFEADGEGWE